MRANGHLLLFALIVNASIAGQAPKEPIFARGGVIAVQDAEDQPKLEESGSVASAVEIWIARIDHWPAEYKNRLNNDYILVEYRYSRPSEQVGPKDLNRNLWNFELWELSGEEKRSCLVWTTADRFVPTGLAGAKSLPKPSDLPCFLVKKRPIPVPRAQMTH
jgi:hypothetical protein